MNNRALAAFFVLLALCSLLSADLGSRAGGTCRSRQFIAKLYSCKARESARRFPLEVRPS